MTETEDYDKSATPSSHGSTHESGGSDVISIDDLPGVAAAEQFSSWVKVSGKPALYPPVAHAAGHQNGGADELSIAGLSGESADEQKSAWTKVSGKPATFPPSTHKTSHQNGGADEISIAGLSGEAADAQPSTWEKVADKPETFAPSAHKASHENDGADEISIAGLSGEAADEQKSAWTKVSGKPATFPPSTHKTSHENDGADEISIAGLSGEAADAQPSTWAKVSGKPTTLIHSTAVLADNKLVSGDGGSRSVKDCHIVVSDDGEMTNPSQPFFEAYTNVEQEDVTGDGTPYDLTGDFWIEVYDRGNNFSNGTFTAPVAGIYLLTGILRIGGITSDHVNTVFSIVTSNKHYLCYLNTYNCRYVSGDRLYFNMSFPAEMDANDTASLRITAYTGTLVIDLRHDTCFSGGLLC
ncbi:MAG: hypothetical protein JRI34_04875 [Deltaproteobacteria bacterium]|nr:hypothetical protein [Deltaproteobacteria bacterium]